MATSVKKTGFMQRLKQLVKSERGNVSIMAGIAAVPLFLAGGAAIDYERAINTKTMLQASLDSAALFAAQTSITDDTALTNASKPYVTTNYNNTGEAALLNYSAHYDQPNSSIKVTGQASLKTWFMAIVGQTDLVVTAFSTVKRGGSKLEVAVVLDNTGSMAQSGKITAERDATNSLLSYFQALAKNPDDIYVSLIPFDVGVNVGTSNLASNWVGWNDFGACTDNRGRSINLSTRQQCSGNGYTWTLLTAAQRAANWDGCVTDRGDPTSTGLGDPDTTVIVPSIANTSTLFPAVNSATCVQQAMSLSNNWAAMTPVVNAMQPMANTNQAIGLAHGWMSLMGGGPYTVPALNPLYTYKKAVILLTDGLNTANRWTNSTSVIDAREKLTCDNLRAAGITVYTVQVNTGSDPQSDILKYCATDPAGYFYLTNAAQIQTAFASIGQNLAKMYLSE
jgi:Flp pilus assembly protein TadG